MDTSGGGSRLSVRMSRKRDTLKSVDGCVVLKGDDTAWGRLWAAGEGGKKGQRPPEAGFGQLGEEREEGQGREKRREGTA
eukprot:207462-Chlamydomonas_euryale.AAC.1